MSTKRGKQGKRGNGEGSIYQRADKRWVGCITLPQGRRKYLYGATRQEVALKLTSTLKQNQDGLPVATERQTVRQYLMSWLETVKPTLKPSTWQSYSGMVRLYVVPAVGAVGLARLSPQHVQHLYSQLLDAGLSPTTVRHVHAMLHRALDRAVRHAAIPRNIADLVDPPRMRRVEMRTWTQSEARTFLATCQGDRLEALYVLALSTGMRQGELLALRWRHVDLEQRTLEVRGTLQRTPEGLRIAEPKTTQSVRRIELNTLVVEALGQHRLRQREERLHLGDAWDEQDLVFPNELGRPMYNQNLIVRSYFRLVKRAGVPKIRFHDLRHTAASLLLAQGVSPKVISELLGHSQISVTLNLYAHVTPTMQRQASEVMDALLRG